jgi:predicted patatin/cPLA2 family phospholipase
MQNQVAVVEYLLKRKESGNRRDGRKIGLILEGGGMRGAFSTGVACGLGRLGLANCFDFVYGSSSGGCAAVYFLSGDIEKGPIVYSKHLSGFQFVKPWQPKALMDVSYLCDRVMKTVLPFDQEAVRSSASVMKLYTSDAKTGEAICYTNKSKAEISDIMKASCSTPYICLPVDIDGLLQLDGNVTKKLPIEEAISDDCTDILVVTTVPSSFRESVQHIGSLFRNLGMIGLSRDFKSAYEGRRELYNKNLDIAFGVSKKYPNVNIYTISPEYLSSVAEIREKKLKALSDHGIFKAKEAFIGATS